MTESNELWLHLFRSGDPAVFEQLYLTHWHNLYMMALRRLDHAGDAEDVVAIVMAKLWERKEQMRSLEHIKASLFLMARNASIDILRKRAKHNEVIIGDDVNEIPIEKEIELYEIEEHVLRLLIEEEIRKLPPGRGRIMRCYMDGMDIKEIAKKLQVSVHTVRNQMVKARVQMKESLHKYLRQAT